MPVSILASVLTVRLVIGYLGVQGYALYALVATLPLLFPVADLGLGAALTDAFARASYLGREVVRDTLKAVTARILAVSAAIATAAMTLGLTNSWHALLGLAPGPEVELSATVAFCAFALSLPASMGMRILLGAGRNAQVMLWQGCTSVMILGLVWIATTLSLPDWTFPAAPGLAMTSTGLGASLVSLRLGAANASWFLPNWSMGSKSNLWRLAGPMLVLNLALPVAYQSGRLVLSHESDLDQVALYAITFQIYAPLLGLISAGGQSLWPLFAKARDKKGTSWPQLRSISMAFTVGGGLMAIALILLGDQLGGLLSHGQLRPSFPLLAGFAALLLAQAAQYPTGMYMTSPLALRFQARASVVMAAVTGLLAIWITSRFGAAGPVLASLVGFCCFFATPTIWWARRHAMQMGGKR